MNIAERFANVSRVKREHFEELAEIAGQEVWLLLDADPDIDFTTAGKLAHDTELVVLVGLLEWYTSPVAETA